jgi:hypothetical protein
MALRICDTFAERALNFWRPLYFPGSFFNLQKRKKYSINALSGREKLGFIHLPQSQKNGIEFVHVL